LKIGGHRLTLVLLGAGLLLLHGAGLFLQTNAIFNGVIAAALVEGIVYLAAVYCLARMPAGQSALSFILLIAILLRVGTVVFPPYLSSDVYRYVWDGRVQGAGINPYDYIPGDDALTSLRDEAIYPHINRANYAKTIYPPAAQIIYYAVTRISEHITVMKLAMLVFDLATIGLLVLLLRGLGAPPDRVLIYAWHPLTFWEIAGSGHVDGVVVAFLTLAADTPTKHACAHRTFHRARRIGEIFPACHGAGGLPTMGLADARRPCSNRRRPLSAISIGRSPGVGLPAQLSE